MIYFKVDEEPVAKARPKFTRSGHAYTPKKTKDYEESIKFAFMSQTCERMPVYPKGIPLQVDATFAKSVPQSYTKKKREACLNGDILPTGKADLDNYLKAVLDALNGLAFEDDSQIVMTMAEKIYAEQPYVEIKIRSMDELYRDVLK